MPFKTLATTLTKSKRIFVKLLPEILTGVSCVGTVATGYLSAKAATAMERGDAKKAKRMYVLAAASCVISIAGCVGSNRISSHRIKAAFVQLEAEEKMLHKLRDATAAVVGASGMAAVDSKLAEEKVKEEPESVNDPDETGEELFYDIENDYYFRADKCDVLWSMYYSNGFLSQNGYLTVCDFYASIGIDPPSGTEGKGWYIDDNWFNECEIMYLEIDFTEKKKMDDGLEYRILFFGIPPKFNEELLYL